MPKKIYCIYQLAVRIASDEDKVPYCDVCQNFWFDSFSIISIVGVPLCDLSILSFLLALFILAQTTSTKSAKAFIHLHVSLSPNIKAWILFPYGKKNLD